MRNSGRDRRASQDPPPPPPAQPFRDFVGPGRRRTDHPLIVGTIVLCCALMVIFSLAQCFVTLWLGAQIRALVELKDADAQAATNMRQSLSAAMEAQGRMVRRACLNTAKTTNDVADCATAIPPVSPNTKGSGN